MKNSDWDVVFFGFGLMAGIALFSALFQMWRPPNFFDVIKDLRDAITSACFPA